MAPYTYQLTRLELTEQYQQGVGREWKEGYVGVGVIIVMNTNFGFPIINYHAHYQLSCMNVINRFSKIIVLQYLPNLISLQVLRPPQVWNPCHIVSLQCSNGDTIYRAIQYPVTGVGSCYCSTLLLVMAHKRLDTPRSVWFIPHHKNVSILSDP